MWDSKKIKELKTIIEELETTIEERDATIEELVSESEKELDSLEKITERCEEYEAIFKRLYSEIKGFYDLLRELLKVPVISDTEEIQVLVGGMTRFMDILNEMEWNLDDERGPQKS